MAKPAHFLLLLLIGAILIGSQAQSQRPRRPRREMPPREQALVDRLNGKIQELWNDGFESFFPARTQIEEATISDHAVELHFSEGLSWMPIRPNTESELEALMRPWLPLELGSIPLQFFVRSTPLEEWIPKACKPSSAVPPSSRPAALVRPLDLPGPAPRQGLLDRHLTVSASHGWMYDSQKSFRWEWQRARLFNTVEDMHSISYIVPTLIPMLERAGAVVFHVRERDWQTHEVVLDDSSRRNRRSQGRVRSRGFWRTMRDQPGFENGLAPYPDGLNPHRAGSVHVKKTANRPYARFEWIPNIPETGEYGVYVSYHAGPDRPTDARYTVHHLGGQTSFLVNQQIGGNTWVWLGRFKFASGARPWEGRVELTNYSDRPGSMVCADAVKFGGGMGDIIRGGETSGYPRYLEGSRYWLQYAGAPAELTYKMGFNSGYEGPDYTDDFSCRAEWANYLNGAPNGPNKDPNHPGLGIPIDLMFSFHTDAGISDGIVGTLMIYYTRGENGESAFPDGRSRSINRDLADLVQSQIVDDIRGLYSSTWSRRRLTDSNYSESRRGNVPSCLVEIMSHQNFNDMKYGLDPRFQFDVARAMYKGMLRFIAQENGFEPVVQPLPPTHLSVRQTSRDTIELQWQPREDPLEPNARAEGYIVYQRLGEEGGFDNGTYVKDTRLTVGGLKPDTVYSFQVEAVNAGGRGFPSETLAAAVCRESGKKALIVYGFDRISGPSTVQAPGYQGFESSDRGVGRDYYFGRTGVQYDFDPASKFVSNDAPGHGATSGEIENRLERGNTFDYTARHGEALVANGWAFDSVSDEAVEAGRVHLEDYALVDWILGEQRTVHPPAGFIQAGTPDRMVPMFKTFSPAMQARLIDYASAGGALLVSGAYVATDLADSIDDPERDRTFLNKVLRVERVTNHGSNTNDLLPQKGDLFDGLEGLHFARGLEEDGVYGVELPDAIDPVKDSGGRTVLRYADRRFSAGVVHEATETGARTLTLGFPFETIVGKENRANFLKRALEFLAGNKED